MQNDKPKLYTCFSPLLLNLYNLEDAIVVVIDVFRATSTIAAALYNGAKEVVPMDSVEATIAMGSKLGGITAGERDGRIVPGLDHGNSPLEYPREFIEGKTLILTTTNGTKLLHMALQLKASEIVTGAFANLDAVCAHIVSEKKNVILACAGWKDRVNSEDSLFAGAVIEKVRDHFSIHCDSSLMAAELYACVKNDFWNYTRQTTHFHRLASYGLEKDIHWCITPNQANVLPVYRDGALIIN